MGGGCYDGDVASRARSTETEMFRTIPKAEARKLVISRLQNPQKLIRECRDSSEHPNTTPIAVVIDVTLSRQKDIGIIYQKLPMFIGQIIMNGYVSDPTVSFAAVGDATCGDEFPIQIGEFEADNRLDDSLNAIILEEGGGGGTGQESYQLMAYYYAYHSELDCLKRGQKGYCFFIGDEGFYPKISKKEVKKIFGEELPDDLSSAEVFAKLQEKFNVFFIYAQKPWEEKKKGVDAEIRQRVEKAGGLYEGVDIRASLIWNNRNDLDLHCITPKGEEIFYGNKRVTCGGELDVDRNVGGETTKPVENIRWAKGRAKPGHYRFFVENFRFWEESSAATRFKVELEVNGEIQHFELATPARSTHASSRIEVVDFEYDPSKQSLAKTDEYAAYDEAVIKNQWSHVIPKAHVISITEPKAVVDAMLGVLALFNGKRSLEGYIQDMKVRDQTEPRQLEIRRALGDLAVAYGLEKVVFAGQVSTHQNRPSNIVRF